MADLTVYDFLDLEAIVDNEEEEEDFEDELDDFLAADDIEESELDWARPRSQSPSAMNQEAAELRALALSRRGGVRVSSIVDQDEVPRHFLVPTQGDLDLWAVRVKHGFESKLVVQIFRRSVIGDRPQRPRIASVFARPGVPGHVFIEGRLPDVTAALDGLVTVYRTKPRLVPLDDRIKLLSARNPLSRSVQEGDWVRITHGLYRNDKGIVCEVDSTSDASVIVALVPRIPNNPGKSPKRKRVNRPEARWWSARQVEAMWGKSHVRVVSEDEYELGGDTYRSGLILKRFPPASIVVDTKAPANIGPFAESAYIMGLDFFDSMARRYAQDLIKVGQRVRVTSGEQRDLVGYPVDITDGVADVIQRAGEPEMPLLKIPLGSLLPEYLPGDHVKFGWCDRHGLVSNVDPPRICFVETDTHKELKTHVYFVEAYTPPSTFYQFTPGTWVNFNGPDDTEGPKRRGWVSRVEDAEAVVVDERTYKVFRLFTRDLEVSPLQAYSIPTDVRVDPLQGKRVVVTHGPHRGYVGYVREPGNDSVVVELSALIASSASSSRQNFRRDHIRLLSSEEEIARSNPFPRARTPTPPPADHPRPLTPEPEGSHWIFTREIRSMLLYKTIPFRIRDTHLSDDKSLQVYEKTMGRTIRGDRWTTTPKDGEVLLSVVRRGRAKQVSFHPRHLVPDEPVVGGEVVVTKGSLFGETGLVKSKGPQGYVVTFKIGDAWMDFTRGRDELAAIETM